MEIRRNHYPEATSSSIASTSQPNPLPQDTALEPTSYTRQTRSSARVRAAKQKAAQLSAQSSHSGTANPPLEGASSSATTEPISTRNGRISPLKATRSRDVISTKGKGKEVVQDPSRPPKRRVTRIYLYFDLTDIDSILLRTRRNPTVLTIDEPVKDLKGKKRAAPEPAEDESTSSSTKRPKTLVKPSSFHQLEMPRKTRLVLFFLNK
jgi:E3 ubiquitin-protein ligase TRIP12